MVASSIVLLSGCGSSSDSTPQQQTSQKQYTPQYEQREPENAESSSSSEAITTNRYFSVNSPTVCSLENQKKYVHDVMHDSYLWADEVPYLDYTHYSYSSAEKILEALKNEKDHFSFIMDAKEANEYFEEGKNENFGFGATPATYNGDYFFTIRYVYPLSPADKAGLKRGDIITHVDHKKITYESLEEISQMIYTKDSLTFTIIKKGDKKITKASYDIQTILAWEVFQNDRHKVGYMVYQDFLDNSKRDLDTIFTEFKSRGVTDLILDLRYNGGGSGDIANHLSSLIGGRNTSGKIFHKITLNQKYSAYNQLSYFEQYNPNALNLNRVFVITTPNTCSASELVINSLRASANNIKVIQIGEKTCGKPYGFAGSGIFCDKALYAINLQTKNSDDFGNYENGFIPTCEAYDNIYADFGDQKESSLSEALYYIQNNTCSPKNREKRAIKTKILPLEKKGFKRIMSAY
jgi:C-terminal processing protease CtpA/Prc